MVVNPDCRSDIVLDRQPQYYPGAEPYAQELLTRLYQAHHDITRIWNDINTEREEAINNATHQPSYKVNDTVWYSIQRHKKVILVS